jgi:hypothetical protein
MRITAFFFYTNFFKNSCLEAALEILSHANTLICKRFIYGYR